VLLHANRGVALQSVLELRRLGSDHNLRAAAAMLHLRLVPIFVAASVGAQTQAQPSAAVPPSAPPANVTTESAALQPVGPAESYAAYKHIDAQGKVTYTNFPVKGAQRLELEPLPTPVVPGLTPASGLAGVPASARSVPGTSLKASTGLSQQGTKPAVASVAVPSVEPQIQKKRDDQRRQILETELKQEERLLNEVRGKLDGEQKNAEALKTTLAEMQAAKITSADAMKSVEKNRERLASLQQTLADHQRNVDALKKELAALK
jgi:hypothetical protein